MRGDGLRRGHPRLNLHAVTRAYAYIVARLGGEYEAGAQLHVEMIAHELQMSRQPVRDAVHRLANEGLVVITPQVGCWIVEPRANDVRDLWALVGAADVAFVPMATARATPESLGRLVACRAKIDRLLAPDWLGVDDGEPARLAVLEYHEELYSVTTSRVVIDAVTRVRSHAMQLTKMLFFQRRRRVPSKDVLASFQNAVRFQLREIDDELAAIVRGDVELAGRLARDRALSVAAQIRDVE